MRILVDCPSVRESRPWPCGQCWQCRVNRQRQRAARLVLEQRFQEKAAFVTLTYRDEEIPLRVDEETGWVRRELDPTVSRPLIERLKRKLGRTGVRYCLVGEYGGRTERPHYHLALYGVSSGELQRGPEGNHELDYRNVRGSNWLAQEVWKLGGCDVGELNDKSAMYVARYTLKKLADANARELDGRPPVFTRWSLRPPIGAAAVPFLATAYEEDDGKRYLEEEGDIIPLVRVEGRVWPLDRTMQNCLRDELGLERRWADRVVMAGRHLPKRAVHIPSAEEREHGRNRARNAEHELHQRAQVVAF